MPMHAMKTQSGTDVELHSFLTSASEVNSQLHAPTALPPKKESAVPLEEEAEGAAKPHLKALWTLASPVNWTMIPRLSSHSLVTTPNIPFQRTCQQRLTENNTFFIVPMQLGRLRSCWRVYEQDHKPFFLDCWPLKTRRIGCPETLVTTNLRCVTSQKS